MVSVYNNSHCPYQKLQIMTCSTCPFSCSDEAAQAQNYGCLPTPQEIIKIKRATGRNWHCHDDETKLCAGFAEAAHEEGLDVKQGEPALYSHWYKEPYPLEQLSLIHI